MSDGMCNRNWIPSRLFFSACYSQKNFWQTISLSCETLQSGRWKIYWISDSPPALPDVSSIMDNPWSEVKELSTIFFNLRRWKCLLSFLFCLFQKLLSSAWKTRKFTAWNKTENEQNWVHEMIGDCLKVESHENWFCKIYSFVFVWLPFP